MQVKVIETSLASSARRRFVCKRCHHGRSAEVSATGHGNQLAIQTSGLSNERASANLVTELDRTIAAARCSRCEKRNPGAAWQFWRRYVLDAIVVIAIGVGLSLWASRGAGEHAVSLFWLGFALVGGVGVISALVRGGSRWSSIDRRVEWLEEG